jgi:hypothetical protein
LTLDPAAGLSLITLPAATLALLAEATVPSTRPALVMDVVAAACVWPTTFGTETWAGVLLDPPQPASAKAAANNIAPEIEAHLVWTLIKLIEILPEFSFAGRIGKPLQQE